MNASEARKMSSGKDYSDYAFDRVIAQIKYAECPRGNTYCTYMWSGSSAICPETFNRVIKKLETAGYKVHRTGGHSIFIDWRSK